MGTTWEKSQFYVHPFTQLWKWMDVAAYLMQVDAKHALLYKQTKKLVSNCENMVTDEISFFV